VNAVWSNGREEGAVCSCRGADGREGERKSRGRGKRGTEWTKETAAMQRRDDGGEEVKVRKEWRS
jgi:hypothetical protein